MTETEMSAEMRTCRVCRKEKPLQDFRVQKSRGRKPYRRKDCKLCQSQRRIELARTHREQENARQRKYWGKPENRERRRNRLRELTATGRYGEKRRKWVENNKDSVKASKRRYELEHRDDPIYREKGAVRVRRYQKKNRAALRAKGRKDWKELTDAVVRKVIVQQTDMRVLSHKDIPLEMVEAKREHMKLRRLLRRLK